MIVDVFHHRFLFFVFSSFFFHYFFIFFLFSYVPCLSCLFHCLFIFSFVVVELSCDLSDFH